MKSELYTRTTNCNRKMKENEWGRKLAQLLEAVRAGLSLFDPKILSIDPTVSHSALQMLQWWERVATKQRRDDTDLSTVSHSA